MSIQRLSREEARLFLEQVRIGQQLAPEAAPAVLQALREQAAQLRAGLKRAQVAAAKAGQQAVWASSLAIPGGRPAGPPGLSPAAYYAAVASLLRQLDLAGAEWARQQATAIRRQYPGLETHLDPDRMAAALRRGRRVLAGTAWVEADSLLHLPDEDYLALAGGASEPETDDDSSDPAGEGPPTDPVVTASGSSGSGYHPPPPAEASPTGGATAGWHQAAPAAAETGVDDNYPALEWSSLE